MLDIRVDESIWLNMADVMSGKVRVLGFAAAPKDSTRLTTIYSAEDRDADLSVEGLQAIDPEGLLGTVVVFKLHKVLKTDGTGRHQVENDAGRVKAEHVSDAVAAVNVLSFLKSLEIRMKLLERFDHPDSPIRQLMRITVEDAELLKEIIASLGTHFVK